MRSTGLDSFCPIVVLDGRSQIAVCQQVTRNPNLLRRCDSPRRRRGVAGVESNKDAVSADDKQALLAALGSDVRLPPEHALAVQIRTKATVEQAVDLIPKLADRGSALRACVEVLVQAKDRKALINVLTSQNASSRARLITLRGLKKIEAIDELKEIVKSDNVAYPLRRRASEALYESTVDENTAKLLLSFFDSLPNSEGARILEQRAFLEYILGRNEIAIKLLDQLATLRQPSAFRLVVYAHCLQQLSRNDEAIAAYSKALDLQPSYAFALCQRGAIYWSRDELSRVAKDAETVGPCSSLRLVSPVCY
jgi:tetratricopeptide (TPR) repeat protein